MDSTTSTTFSYVIFLLPLPGYQLKPVKESSKVPDFNTYLHYYYASRTSIYIYMYIYIYMCVYRKFQIDTPLIVSRLFRLLANYHYFTCYCKSTTHVFSPVVRLTLAFQPLQMLLPANNSTRTYLTYLVSAAKAFKISIISKYIQT